MPKIRKNAKNCYNVVVDRQGWDRRFVYARPKNPWGPTFQVLKSSPQALSLNICPTSLIDFVTLTLLSGMGPRDPWEKNWSPDH